MAVTNPHVATALQAGAANQAILDAHTGDTANPHQTTAAQTGATDAGAFSAHTADAAPHHSRYSDAEGVAAVLASDGPGSGFDADTLDGSEASTFTAGIDGNAAAISSNTDAIAANTQATLDNSAAIYEINSALVVKANGPVIGTFAGAREFPDGDSLWVLSANSYLFPLLQDTGEIYGEDLAFEQDACIGQAYSGGFPWEEHTANDPVARAAGWVMRASGSQLFYAQPGSTVQTISQVSKLNLDGFCEWVGGVDVPGVPVLPNDPSVTSISAVSFPLPITIGLPVQDAAIEIGTAGSAGGIVFYVTADGLHGLEAAPAADQAPDPEWDCDNELIIGADGVIVRTGAQNTADIIVGCAEPGIAARVADTYVLNGYDDWFLPSKGELNELYLQKDVVGGFANEIYWSSSEDISAAAWAQNFLNGNQASRGKNNSFIVRAIRAF